MVSVRFCIATATGSRVDSRVHTAAQLAAAPVPSRESFENKVSVEKEESSARRLSAPPSQKGYDFGLDGNSRVFISVVAAVGPASVVDEVDCAELVEEAMMTARSRLGGSRL